MRSDIEQSQEAEKNWSPNEITNQRLYQIYLENNSVIKTDRMKQTKDREYQKVFEELKSKYEWDSFAGFLSKEYTQTLKTFMTFDGMTKLPPGDETIISDFEAHLRKVCFEEMKSEISEDWGLDE